MLAYLDSMTGGAVPVRIIHATRFGANDWSFTVRTTAARGPYDRGVVLRAFSGHSVFPRQCLRRGSARRGVARILPYSWDSILPVAASRAVSPDGATHVFDAATLRRIAANAKPAEG